RAGLHASFGEQQRQRNAGPLAAADEAVTPLDVGSGRGPPLAGAVAAAFERQDARDRRQAPDLGHRKGERPIHQAMNDEAMARGIDRWDARVMPLVVER